MALNKLPLRAKALMGCSGGIYMRRLRVYTASGFRSEQNISRARVNRTNESSMRVAIVNARRTLQRCNCWAVTVRGGARIGG